MRRYGLIGRKLSHSFSKEYFSRKFTTEGIEAQYALYELEEAEAVNQLISSDKSLCGLNVTIPYKQSILPYLDSLSEEAEAVGAVNCIAIKEGKRRGYNTDIIGIEKTLDTLPMSSSYRAIVLGTGGAAKAVEYVLRRRQIEYLTVSRSAERGDITYDDLSADMIASHKLIINTTPLGMYPDVQTLPQIDYRAITAQHSVFDLVYNPDPTLFMQRAAEQGATVVGGKRMLYAQAEASWQIWNKQ